MFFAEIHSIQKSQDLIDTASQIQMVDRGVLENAILVNDEQTAQGDAGPLQKDAIAARDVLAQVRHQRVVHAFDAAFFAIHLRPCVMRELRINRYADDFSISFLEFLEMIGERENFRWADKREIEWIEKQNDLLALVIGQRNFFEFAVHERVGREVWGLLRNKCRQSDLLMVLKKTMLTDEINILASGSNRAAGIMAACAVFHASRTN
jgi:hypothetical protein